MWDASLSLLIKFYQFKLNKKPLEKFLRIKYIVYGTFETTKTHNHYIQTLYEMQANNFLPTPKIGLYYDLNYSLQKESKIVAKSH